MSETASPPVLTDNDRLLVILSYALFLLGFAGGLPMLAGFIVAMVRKPHARGTIYESHYRNLILVFFVLLGFAGLVMAMAMAGLMDFLFGFFSHPDFVYWPMPMAAVLIPGAALCSLLLGLWFFWRIVRGFILVLDEKPY